MSLSKKGQTSMRIITNGQVIAILSLQFLAAEQPPQLKMTKRLNHSCEAAGYWNYSKWPRVLRMMSREWILSDFEFVSPMHTCTAQSAVGYCSTRPDPLKVNGLKMSNHLVSWHCGSP